MQLDTASVPAPFHAGMQEAFMDCLTLLIEEQLDDGALYCAVLRKLYALWPPAYHRYYLRGPDSGEPFLTYRQWGTLVEELRETLQFNQIMAQPPDSRVMAMRRKLLLTHGETLEEQPDRSRPEVQARNGKVEAYMAVVHAMFYDKLGGDTLSAYLSEHIFAVTASPIHGQ